MKPSSLPRCKPEEIGLSSRQVAACIKALSHEKTTMNGFMAARHGKVFAACWWAPYRPDIPHSNHSFGKSYTSTAIGIAVGEGLLSLDEHMVDIFAPEIQSRQITLPTGIEKITVRHVLTMTNGMAYHPDMHGDFIRNYFTTPLAYEPGTHFAYNSTGSCMLGAIIRKRTGQNLKDYLTPRLFEPIGIDPSTFIWRRFRDLDLDGEPGTFSTTEAHLRLALLYVQGGRWGGRQILPADYVRDSLSVQIHNEYAPEQKDGRCGYGYQLWACSIPGVYRFDGGQGQYGIIWPEKDLVISLHEGAIVPYGPQKTLDVLYETLFSHLSDEPLPDDPEGMALLIETEQSATLPNDPASSFPLNPTLTGSYAIRGNFDPWFAVAPPGQDDLFVMFRTPALDLPVERITLSFTPKTCTLEMGEGRILTAAWDGKLTARFVENSPYDPLGDYAATACCTADGCLEMRIHWLNGWFESDLLFTPSPKGLNITIRKVRLNDEDNELHYHAEAILEREK